MKNNKGKFKKRCINDALGLHDVFAKKLEIKCFISETFDPDEQLNITPLHQHV